MDLSAMFPDLDLVTLANTVKQANLNFDGALELCLKESTALKKLEQAKRDSQPPAVPKSEPKIDNQAPSGAQGASAHPAETPAASKDLARKYRDELEQVRSLISNPDIPDDVILDKLAAAKGDVEKVILLFVDSDEKPAASEEPVATKPKLDKGKEKLLEDDWQDSEDTFAPSSLEGPGPLGLELSDSDEDSHEYEFDSTDEAFPIDSGSDKEHQAASGSEDDEIDSWFEQPDVSDIRTQRALKEEAPAQVDAFTLLLQEEADKEYAQYLQEELDRQERAARRGASNPNYASGYGNAATNPFARLAATPASANTPWSFSEFQRSTYEPPPPPPKKKTVCCAEFSCF